LFDFCEDFAQEHHAIPVEFETENEVMGKREIEAALTGEQKARLAALVGQTH
jgi:hypothetical protein